MATTKARGWKMERASVHHHTVHRRALQDIPARAVDHASVG